MEKIFIFVPLNHKKFSQFARHNKSVSCQEETELKCKLRNSKCKVFRCYSMA